MRLSFAKNPSPMVVGVVRRRTVREAIAEIKNCTLHGADAIDLHISCLEKEFQNKKSIAEIVTASRLPILALHYDQDYEMNPLGSAEEERVALLLEAVEAGCSGIDMQGYTFDLYSKKNFREGFGAYSFTKDCPREIVLDPAVIQKQKELIGKVHAMGGEVLLSVHPMIPMDCGQVVELAKFLEQRGPDIIKIICRADTEEQLAESFATMIRLKKEIKTPIHYHCAGEVGKPSRIINPLLGGYLCFCNDGYHAGSNLEQPDLQIVRAIIDGYKRSR